MPALVPLLISPKFSKLGYAIIGVMIAAQIGALFYVGNYCYFYFSSFAFQGNDNYAYVSENQPEDCTPYSDSYLEKLWPQEYFAPFYRFAPYLIGMVTGHWLANKKMHAKTGLAQGF